jgi:hypothetical protein
MAVLQEWRRQGSVGELLLRALIEKVRNLSLANLTANAELD